jgi:hypothetical protein
MTKRLRDQINDLVVAFLREKLRTGEVVNTPDMAGEMAKSIVDMILQQDEDDQAPLLAGTIATLGEFYLRERGLLTSKN